ncbi:MAG TPA: SRPBCC family protein [Kofleriaceae bacterium]
MKSVSAFQSHQDSDDAPGTTLLSRGLGWFSIALGVTELAVPRTLARTIGVDPDGATPWILRAMGAREILAGLGVLMQPQRPVPLWGRVAGDAIDLALLGIGAAFKRTSTPRIAGAIAAVAGVTALDVIAGTRTQRSFQRANRPVVYSVTINKPPEEVYAFFRKFSQLPQFMSYLESVREIDARRSHWVARLPIGGTVAWDAEITEDIPGQLIAWRSVEYSTVTTRGRVTFATAPARDMTEVRVEMQLGFLGTEPSATLAKFFSKPQIKGDLRRFKQVMETGEVLHSDASVHRRPHAAQPPRSDESIERSDMFSANPPTAATGVTPVANPPPNARVTIDTGSAQTAGAKGVTP